MSLVPIGSGAIGDDGGASDVSTVVGSASVPIRISVGAIGNASVPIRVWVVAPEIANGSETVSDGGTAAAVWGIVVEIDDEDVTDDIIGEVTVEAEENAARVADFSIYQPTGTVVVPSEWPGRPVSIWLADMSTGIPVNPMQIFSGVVDLPTVTPRSGIIGLRCTDNRQGHLAAMSRSQIDALLPSARYSTAVFDRGAASLQYANDLLSTAPVAVDLSPHGVMRSTDWAAKETADLSFDEDQILDGSLVVNIAERSGLINRVTVNFGYRFPRMKAEGYEVGYDFLALNMTSFASWVTDMNYFLQRAAVVSALEKSGGSIVSIQWIELPTDPVYLPEIDGYWNPVQAVHDIWCLGFGAVVAFDYAQTHDETYTLTVENAASIAAVGVIPDQLYGALEGVFDDPVAAEQNVLMYRQQMAVIPPKSVAAVAVGLTNSVDPVLSDDTDRAAAEAAIECLVATAMTKIHSAHRQHSVSAAVAANPVIDVDKTIAINAGGVNAQGKVRRLVHRLNPDTGSATTDFDLAICSIAGVGIDHPADTVVAPDGSDAGTSNTLESPDITWNGLYGQDQVFSISFAGVEEIERQKATHAISQTYSAPLYEDILEITL